MAMFQKFLASIGIGSAKVDTILNTPQVRPGEKLEGEVHVQGGNVDQFVERINLFLTAKYYKEVDDTTYILDAVLLNHQVSGSFTIAPKEKKVIPFQFTVPYHTPISFGKGQVFLKTGLDIENAVDPKDLDPIKVLPDPIVSAVFEEMDRLGFQHTYDSGKCSYVKYRGRNLPFIQEFELKPTHAFRGQLDEVEFSFDVGPDGVQVLMQVDKRARGFLGLLEEAMDMDERYLRFFIPRGTGLQPGQIESLIHKGLAR
jgi:sporulation-control protein